MKMRSLGSSGLLSSAIGMGTAALTGTYGPVTVADCDRTVHLALDTGITMFDATGARSAGERAAEVLLGRALSGRRAEALIATRARWPTEGIGEPGVNHGPAYLAVACDESLQRLRTDYIDIFYLPRDPRFPVEEGVCKLAELATAGKIRYLGMCMPSADELRRAHATHPVSAVAVEYSLRRPTAEKEVLAMAVPLGVGVVACRPLGGGLLAGRSVPGVSARDRTALRTIEAEATDLNLGMARLALAWLLAQRPDVVPVPSTRKPTHVEMNASAVDLALSEETCARLARQFQEADEC